MKLRSTFILAKQKYHLYWKLIWSVSFKINIKIAWNALLREPKIEKNNSSNNCINDAYYSNCALWVKVSFSPRRGRHIVFLLQIERILGLE